MSNALMDAIQQGAESHKPLLWLDAEAYGSEVLLKGRPFPWSNTPELVGHYTRLQSLLKPDVAPVNIGSFLSSWLQANSGVLVEMRGKKRIRFALKKLLGMEQLRESVRETVSALCGSISQPLVLILPPNGELINWANQLANQAPAAEISDLDVDSVSVYLADFLRAFSSLDVTGVIVRLPDGSGIDDELLTLYSPIINVAGHYRWAFGLEVTNPTAIEIEQESQQRKVDILIADHAGANAVILDSAFWHNQSIPDEVIKNAKLRFYFSRVPQDIEPEQVLERIAALRDSGQ